MTPTLYRYKDSIECIKPMPGHTPGEGWTPLYDQDAMDAAICVVAALLMVHERRGEQTAKTLAAQMIQSAREDAA